MWAKIARIIIKYRVLLVTAILLTTALMGFLANKIEVSYSGTKVLPVTDPNYVVYEKFKNEFGEDGNAMFVGVETSKLFEENFYADWYQLTLDIKKLEGITEVLSTANFFKLQKNEEEKKFDLISVVTEVPVDQSGVDSIKKELFNLPFYDGFLYSKDANVTAMAITFRQEELNSFKRISLCNEIAKLCEPLEKKYNIEVHYSGLPFIRSAIAQKVNDEFYLFLILAISVTALILGLFFRSFTAVIFPVIVVIIGVIWTVGMTQLLGFKITILTGLIPPLIVVIGIPNSVLMLNKYHVEYRKHRDKKRALFMMIQRIGFTTFIANLTTAIGFGVFAFTESSLLKEFGIITPIMVMATYMVTLIMIPIVYFYLPEPSLKQTKHLESKFLKTVLNRLIWLVSMKRKTVYIVTTVIVAIALYGLSKIDINRHVLDDLPEGDKVYTDLHFFEKHFKGLMPFEVLIDTKKDNKATSMGTIKRIDQMQDLLQSYPQFSRPISFVEALKFSNQAFFNGNPSFYRVPSTYELPFIAAYASQEDGGEENKMLRSMLDSNKRVARVSFQMADIGSKKMAPLMEELKPRIDSIFNPERYDVTYTGASLIFLKGNDYLVSNLRESLILAVAIISIILLLLFRRANFKLVIISLLPNLIPLLVTAGIMGYFGIQLKPSSILIFSIAFGIASDQTIYFLTKFRQDSKYHKWTISETIAATIQETGVSMIYTAIILFFGFAIFAASSFGGTVALGILVSITLLMSVIANLTLLPTLLYSFERNQFVSEADRAKTKDIPGLHGEEAEEIETELPIVNQRNMVD